MLPALLALLFAPLVLLFAICAAATPDPSPVSPFGVGFPRKALPAASSPPVLTPERTEHFDVEVLPFVLVSTIDGALHAIDRETGDMRWTLRDGVKPLVGGGVYGKRNDVEYIVEPLSGNLYMFEAEAEDIEGPPKVRKLPLTVEQLIERSPMAFPEAPNRFVTGQKITSLITLDLKTGKQLDHFCPQGPHDNLSSPGVCDNDILDELEGRPYRDTLYVGRTDYRLTISSADFPSVAAPLGGKRASVQEITYSTYTPNSYDRSLAEFWARNGAQNWADENRVRVELHFEGYCFGLRKNEDLKWHTSLGAVPVAVYDVVLPLAHSGHPVILPQPAVDLSALVTSSHYDTLASKPASAYIGSVNPAIPAPEPAEEDPEPRPKTKPVLFAQSSEAYPLIRLRERPPRPGTLVNGSFQLLDDEPGKAGLLPYIPEPPTLPPANVPPLALGPPPSQWYTHWSTVFVVETMAVVLCGIAIYRWAFRKATALANERVISLNEKSPLLQPATLNGDGVNGTATPVVRFEALPEPDAVGSADSGTPKKKPGRRRVRGKGAKRRRRSGSVGPQDDGDDDDVEDDVSEGRKEPSGSSGSNGSNGSFTLVEKPLPAIPRISSTVSLGDEAERLAISDTVIGFGSHGTVVLKGTWGGRPVAVKRLLADFVRLASQEVKLLQASDDHPNVIRYYCQERRDNFLYIALDLCQASLADLIETPDRHMELSAALDHKRALLQITSGVKHLHAMKIIHRDIKPQNVLVSQAKDGSLRMLVSDFGLARRLEQGQSSFAPTANNLAGSLGWRAPECIKGQVKLNEGFDPAISCSSSGSTTSSTGSLIDLAMTEDGERIKGPPRARLTKAVDLFALGCLYFWILMGGEHPFGETYNREANIVKGDAVNMGHLEILGEEGVEAQHLIGSLLSAEPAERPPTSECLTHPFFWTPAKRLAFLCDASDRFEIMETEPPEPTLVMLEADAPSVVGKDWYSRMDRVFTASLGKYRKYKGNTVRDLLRAMRNKKHHYQDMEPSAQRHLGALPAGFLHYFTSRFPRLFLHVHGVVRESRLRHEPMFEGYFAEKE